MTIEIKLTCETVVDAQAEMLVLLRGMNIISGSEPKVPSTPERPVLTSTTATTPSSPPTGSETSFEQPSASAPPVTASLPEQPAKRRGRPKKDAGQLVATAELTDTSEMEAPSTNPNAVSSEAVGDEGNEPSGEVSATETVGQTSDAASSTSTESAPAETEEPAVTDTELQKYCARLAAHFGGPQKIFAACEPFLAEGEVARPTNIKSNSDRWRFIRQMETESGLKYHG